MALTDVAVRALKAESSGEWIINFMGSVGPSALMLTRVSED